MVAGEIAAYGFLESREVLEETATRTAEGAGVCVGRPVASAEVAIVRIDDTTPVTSSDIDEAWSNGPVTVTLSADDGVLSGIDTVYYSTDGSEPSAGIRQLGSKPRACPG